MLTNAVKLYNTLFKLLNYPDNETNLCIKDTLIYQHNSIYYTILIESVPYYLYWKQLSLDLYRGRITTTLKTTEITALMFPVLINNRCYETDSYLVFTSIQLFRIVEQFTAEIVKWTNEWNRDSVYIDCFYTTSKNLIDKSNEIKNYIYLIRDWQSNIQDKLWQQPIDNDPFQQLHCSIVNDFLPLLRVLCYWNYGCYLNGKNDIDAIKRQRIVNVWLGGKSISIKSENYILQQFYLKLINSMTIGIVLCRADQALEDGNKKLCVSLHKVAESTFGWKQSLISMQLERELTNDAADGETGSTIEEMGFARPVPIPDLTLFQHCELHSSFSSSLLGLSRQRI